MLTIEQCDKTLNKNPKKKKFTKEEVVKIKNLLYKMARIVVESQKIASDER
ncbi:hypothetical protein [Flavobacterium sp. CS20]|uniref:hypothetical protein n=1 Tax=Flavobacterium sp. CS20 TaxID=2775246 RepID=UPI001B3A6E34|nr:hypothetical protein [Flavobacterium sp. CS20]QTY25961.1 hypothetical protein IGB25_08025 [Flavobacterium sp. CS20]